MAKKKVIIPEVKAKYEYPSRYGTHSSMILKEETEDIGMEEVVICKDEYGKYATTTRHVDSGMADPNRYLFPKKREAVLKRLHKKVK